VSDINGARPLRLESGRDGALGAYWILSGVTTAVESHTAKIFGVVTGVSRHALGIVLKHIRSRAGELISMFARMWPKVVTSPRQRSTNFLIVVCIAR
jgi:hypothetical protein